jgi:hypothetical protein
VQVFSKCSLFNGLVIAKKVKSIAKRSLKAKLGIELMAIRLWHGIRSRCRVKSKPNRRQDVLLAFYCIFMLGFM